MQNINDKSHSKLIRIDFIPNLYRKVRNPLLISFVEHLNC